MNSLEAKEMHEVDRIMLHEIGKVRYWLTKAYNHNKKGEWERAISLVKDASTELNAYLRLLREKK